MASQSPELSPIENFRSSLRQCVYSRYPTTQKELEDFILKEWEKTPDSIVKSLIDSMTKRIEKVIKSNGTIIDY